MRVHLKGDITKILEDVFPKIGIDRLKFDHSIHKSTLLFKNIFNCIAENHWQDSANRREFFEKRAKELGYDPLLPETWYKIAPTVYRSKVCHVAAVLALIVTVFNVGIEIPSA